MAKTFDDMPKIDNPKTSRKGCFRIIEKTARSKLC